MRFLKLTIFLCAIAFGVSACSKKDDPAVRGTSDSETAQQVGDAMASIDESGGSNGGFAFHGEIIGAERTFARLGLTDHTSKKQAAYSVVLPEAKAASCATGSTFSSCSNNVITRTFNGCSIGTATLDGTVTLTWAASAVNNT